MCYAKATKGTGASSTTHKTENKKATKTFTVDPKWVTEHREWVYCHHCYTLGKYFQRKCKATQQELRQENRREKPTGSAMDRYYQ